MCGCTPATLPLTGDALVEAARGCRVIISYRQSAAPAELFRALPELAVFQRCAVDVRNVDLAAASAAGVLVTHASAGFANSVAEWVLGAMIDLARHVTDATVAYRSGAQPPLRMGSELRGATLGVIGYGVIGKRLAAIADCLGMRVLVTDPVEKIPPPFTAASLEQLLPQADYVACLAPARPETENLMDARRFAAMKPGAVFINASRGELVDEAALLHALDSGHLGGCALGRRPRTGSDAVAGSGRESARDRHTAHRRHDAAGRGAPVARDGGAAGRTAGGPHARRRPQPGEGHAPAPPQSPTEVYPCKLPIPRASSPASSSPIRASRCWTSASSSCACSALRWNRS